MNRLGLLYPSELDGDAKSLYDELYAYTTAKYGTGLVFCNFFKE